MLKMMPDSRNHGRHRIIKLRGIVARGAGKASFFTEIPWVKKQFAEKLGVTPHPGTFNIMVLAEDRDKLNIIRASKGIEIEPENANSCVANSFLALISHKIKGAIIIPRVANYPPAQLEIIAAENIKQSLSLKDGDPIEIEAYL